MRKKANQNTRLLVRHIWLTRAVLVGEQIWSSSLIPLCVIGLFVALSWFGLFKLLPYWLNFILLLAFLLGFLVSLRAFLRLRWPTEAHINRRLEEDNQIPHEGISIFTQALEQDNQPANALWAEHKRRMRQQLADLRLSQPRSDIPERDPYGIRVLIVMLLVTAYGFSYSTQSGQLGDILALPKADDMSGDNLRMDAWVSPPDYVNRAPIYLTNRTSEVEPIAIPAQSEVIVRLSGRTEEDFAPYFERAGGIRIPLSRSDNGDIAANSYETFTIAPEQNGQLFVGTRWQWSFSIIKDQPPSIRFEKYPEQALNGALELTYQAEDDYGLSEAWAEIVSVIPSDDHALPLFELPKFALDLPRRSNPDDIGSTSQDLTDHPLAGEDVYLTLYAKDGAGQIAKSQDLEITLPMRPFSSPLALSILEQRQVLAFDAYDLPRAIELNDALTILPEETIPSLTDYLLIKSARAGLDLAHSRTQLLEWVDNLWNIALILEDGELSLAEQRLKQAQEALQDALENGASDEEIAQLMDELRQAMNEFLQALMQNNNMNQTPSEQQANAQEMEMQDLNDFLDQIENMARSGNREQAQQMLNELQNMMNNMQANRNQQPQNGEPSPMEQQLEQLGDILRQQQELMDETFGLQQEQRRMRENQQSQNRQNNQNAQPSQRRNQEQNQRLGERPNDQQQNGQQQNEQQPNQMTAEELADALERLRQQQEALEQQLQDLQEQMQGQGMEPNEGLGEAGEAMEQAEGELGRGQTEGAGEQQARALEALRQGAEQMLNELQQQMQADQGEQQGNGLQQFGQQQGPGQTPGGRDPLGRMQDGDREGMFGQNPNAAFGDGKNIQRAREILEIIRKRLGENFRLDLEKQYLERLLQTPQ